MATLIKRKPVPPRRPLEPKLEKELIQPADVSSDNKAQIAVPDDKYAVLEEPTQQGEAQPDLEEQLEKLELETSDAGALPTLTDTTLTEEPSAIAPGQTTDQKPSMMKTALSEVKHFAGGLIAHPYEATRHHSVMRHSHGLVYYQGPTTSVAITIFSDRPLSSNRKLWLQKRGFSGRTGLKVGAALGTRSAWIDVTPSIDGTADLFPKDDEKARQRDISKFLKKAKTAKHLSNHRPIETDVIRIPHVAEDGYFRIVLCEGRKVLCPSPIFRYASSSLDPSILRGASLRTLPLEVGIRIGSFVARNAANTAAHGAMQPAISTVQTMAQPYQPSGTVQWAATTAYDASGAAEQVDGTIQSVNDQYDEKSQLAYQSVSGEAVQGVKLVGDESGPQQPYPIKMSGRVIQGSGNGRLRFGMPTATVVDVPEDTLLRLSGVYMGWCSISKMKISKTSVLPDDAYETWYQAVIMVRPRQETQIRVVQQKEVTVHLVNDFANAPFFETRLNILILAYLHSAEIAAAVSGSEIEAQQAQMTNDIAMTKLSLKRQAWTPEQVIWMMKERSSSRSTIERIADVRQAGERQIGRVPVHRLGVRTDSMGLKDQLIGTGGICVRR